MMDEIQIRVKEVIRFIETGFVHVRIKVGIGDYWDQNDLAIVQNPNDVTGVFGLVFVDIKADIITIRDTSGEIYGIFVKSRLESYYAINNTFPEELVEEITKVVRRIYISHSNKQVEISKLPDQYGDW